MSMPDPASGRPPGISRAPTSGCAAADARQRARRQRMRARARLQVSPRSRRVSPPGAATANRAKHAAAVLQVELGAPRTAHETADPESKPQRGPGRAPLSYRHKWISAQQRQPHRQIRQHAHQHGCRAAILRAHRFSAPRRRRRKRAPRGKLPTTRAFPSCPGRAPRRRGGSRDRPPRASTSLRVLLSTHTRARRGAARVRFDVVSFRVPRSPFLLQRRPGPNGPAPSRSTGPSARRAPTR